MTRGLKLAMLAAVPMLTLANAAGYREAVYTTTYFSNATESEIVGYRTPYCTYFRAEYTVDGTVTDYSQTAFVGYCTESGMEPLE